MPATPEKSRPVVILGAGVLGRRIAGVFLAGGHTVHVHDPSPQALTDASTFLKHNLASFTALTSSSSSSSSTPTSFQTFTDIGPAVQNAWLVVEAVPEKLGLKIETFATLDELAPADCIFTSNSSSFRSRLMVEKLGTERRERTLNVHFTNPPEIRTVELMTDGMTREEVFEVVRGALRECGVVPVTARKESTG